MTRRTQRALAASCLFVCSALAHAWTLRVDDAGGPADLAEAVAAAEQRWLEAGADVAAVDRTVLVRYEAELLGPDAVALVVTGGAPGVDLEIWVRAAGITAAERDDALTITLGIALGGVPGSGLLDPRLATEPRVPLATDSAALASVGGVLGDVTGDGSVGFDDLVALAESWGRRGVNLAADLDGDGVVDENDLEVLREQYRFAPLPSERAAVPADEVPSQDEPNLEEPTLDEQTLDEPAGDAPPAPLEEPLHDEEAPGDEETEG